MTDAVSAATPGACGAAVVAADSAAGDDWTDGADSGAAPSDVDEQLVSETQSTRARVAVPRTVLRLEGDG